MSIVNNKTIKDEIRSSGIPQWKVADKVGVSEQTLIRWLRKEVSNEKESIILNAIRELKEVENSVATNEND